MQSLLQSECFTKFLLCAEQPARYEIYIELSNQVSMPNTEAIKLLLVKYVLRGNG